MYMNEGWVSPRRMPSSSIPIAATAEPEQPASYVKFSKSDSPVQHDALVNSPQNVPYEEPVDETNDTLMDKSVTPPMVEEDEVFCPQTELADETGQTVVEIYDIIPTEQAPVSKRKLSIKERALLLGNQLHGTSSSSVDELHGTSSSSIDEVEEGTESEDEGGAVETEPENMPGKEVSAIMKTEGSLPTEDVSVNNERDKSLVPSKDDSVPHQDHQTSQPHAPCSSSIKARAEALQRHMTSRRTTEEPLNSSSDIDSNAEGSRGWSGHSKEQKSSLENSATGTEKNVHSLTSTGLSSTSSSSSLVASEAQVLPSVPVAPVQSKEVEQMSLRRQAPPRPPVSPRPRKANYETSRIKKSPYEQAPPSESENQIPADQTSVPSTSVSMSLNSSGSAQSSAVTEPHHTPVEATTNPSPSPSPSRLPKPPTRPKPAYPRVNPRLSPKKQGSQDNATASGSVAVSTKPTNYPKVKINAGADAAQQHSVDMGSARRTNYPRVKVRENAERKQVSLDRVEITLLAESLPSDSSSVTDRTISPPPKQLSVDSGTVRTRPRRKDYEPRLPGLRQRRDIAGEQNSAKEEERLVMEERRAEQDRQRAEMERERIEEERRQEERRIQEQRKLAEKHWRLQDERRREEEQQQYLEEQKRLRPLRILDHRPSQPSPEDSADLAQLVNELQKANMAPLPPHIGSMHQPRSSFRPQAPIPPTSERQCPSQQAPPPNYPAPRPDMIPLPASQVPRQAHIPAVATSLPVSVTSSILSPPPHALSSFCSYPGPDEPPPIPTRTQDMYLPGSGDSVDPPTTQAQGTSTETPPAQKKRGRNYTNMIPFLRKRKEKELATTGKPAIDEMPKGTERARSVTSASAPNSPPHGWSRKPTVVDMRRRALPPEPDMGAIINQQSCFIDVEEPQEYEAIDSKPIAMHEFQSPAPLSAGVEPSHPFPENMAIPSPFAYHQGMLGAAATPFMGPAPMNTSRVAPALFSQAATPYPVHQPTCALPGVGNAHSTSTDFFPQCLPDTRPPALLPTGISPVRHTRHSPFHSAQSHSPARSKSMRENKISSSDVDEYGYECTDDWVPRSNLSISYDYPERRGIRPPVPLGEVIAPPRRSLQSSAPLHVTPRRAIRSGSVVSDDDDDGYVNMQSEFDLDKEYENAETILQLQQLRLSMLEGANSPPPLPAKASRHHQRRHSMDDHIYYNEDFQEMLEQWRKQNYPDSPSHIGDQFKRSPEKRGPKPVPSPRRQVVPITSPSSQGLSDGEAPCVAGKQLLQQTISQTDEETGQVHDQQTFSTKKLPQQKPKPFLPPRNIPRPPVASVPGYLDIIN